MTQEGLLEAHKREREWSATPIGSAFHRFKNAHSRYWQQDSNETISYKRLRELDVKAREAENEFRKLIGAPTWP